MAIDDRNRDIPLTVEYDGRSRRLRITGREIDQIEAHLGKPIGDVAEDFRKLGYNTLAVLLWQALDDRNLKLGDVKKFLTKKVDQGEDLLDLRLPLNNALILSGAFGQEAIERLREPDATSSNGAARPPGSTATGS